MDTTRLSSFATQTPIEPSKPPRVLTHISAGLTFPVGRIARHMRQRHIANKVTLDSTITLSATLEFMAQEVADIAGEICKQEKRKCIKPRDIRLAFKKDEELEQVAEKSVVSTITNDMLALEKKRMRDKLRKRRVRSRRV